MTYRLVLLLSGFSACLAQVPTPSRAPALPDGPTTTLFDGAALPAGWKMMNPVDDHWTMQPRRKSLLIASQRGPCVSGQSGKNFLVLDRSTPADKFEVVVRAAFKIQAVGTGIALALWADDKNYFWVALQGDNYAGLTRRVYFQKISQGQTAGSFQNDVGGVNEIYLRISRDENEYTGSYAAVDPAKPFDPAKVPWVQLGSLPGIRFNGKVALCAANYLDGAPEASAEFYSVTIR